MNNEQRLNIILERFDKVDFQFKEVLTDLIKSKKANRKMLNLRPKIILFFKE